MRTALAIAAITMASAAHAATCYESPDAVRKANPNAWPRWSLHVRDHVGEHCWYPGSKVRVVVTRRQAPRPPGDPLEPVAAALPYAEPEPSPRYATPPAPALPFGYFVEVFQGFLSPLNRINQSFFELGLRYAPQ